MNTGPAGPVKSWLDRLLELAVTLVVIGLLLTWAWSLIKPLVPVIITATVIVMTITAVIMIIRRRQGGW